VAASSPPGPRRLFDNEGWSLDAWNFGQLWVQLGLGLFVGAFLVGAIHQSRTALAATRAAGGGDDPEAARQLRRWLWGYRLILVLLVIAAWDMTTKPGL
jgi:hypothetical protein